MPASRRDKIITLSKTQKKGRERKEAAIEEIREGIKQYPSIYILGIENSRTTIIQEARRYWKESYRGRFYFGKHSLMRIALGRNKDEEIFPELSQLSLKIGGECCLFMTNQPHEKVLEWTESFTQSEFPRAGFEATQDVSLEAGPLKNFVHSQEPYLRKLGLPTELKNGVIYLISPFVVCKKDDCLTPESARILKLLNIKMSTFRFVIKGYWTDNKFKDEEDK